MTNLQPLQALNLDASQQQSFVRFFNGLSEKPATTIRVFNRVDYYTLHGEDAIFAAMEVFKTTANVKKMGSQPNQLDYVVLSLGNFQNFIRELLLVKQYRVEVYVNQGSARNTDWVVEYKGSPGNLSQLEDLLFSNNDMVSTCTIMAVQIVGDAKNKTLGVACVNADEHTFSITEFVDNDIFTELESLTVQVGPRECLIQKGDTAELVTLKSMLERCGVMVNQHKKTDFNIDDIVQDLNGLLKFEEGQQESANSLPEINKKHAMGSLAALIKYRELTTDSLFSGKFQFNLLDSKRFVHLDSAAVSALNLVPKPGAPTGPSAKYHSIMGLLGRCRTPQGQRLLSQWVKQPLRDINAVTERHDIVQCFLTDVQLRESLHNDYLKRIPDFQMLSKKLNRKKATLQDCYRLFQAVERLPQLVETLTQSNDSVVKGVLVEPILDSLKDLEKYQAMIEETVDMEQVQHGEFLVKPTFDDEFQSLYKEMRQLEKNIQLQLNVAARDLSLESGKTIKLDSNAQLGYFLRVTLKEEPVLRKNNKYKVIDAIKGGVRFTNDKLSELNDDYMQAKKSYEEHQQSIVLEIVNIGASYSEPLARLSAAIAQLDILVGFAVAAASAPKTYVRPIMLPDSAGKISLKAIRHPCLELQEDISYIANDVVFENEITTMYIITGPNMGGKSTYIRSVGVAVLMAHIGSFVACDEAVISMVDCILGRVGADDCLLKGLSTFMTEMIETSGILRTATKHSLVIIDELGRGTSTYEGCGIAWAIAEHLAKQVGSYTLFATHFHEITRLADDVKTLKNCHVSANTDDDNFTLLYQVLPGVCNKSFGIQVARMANFPESVIKFAEDKHAQLEDNTVNADFQTIDEADDLIRKLLDQCKSLDSGLSDEELINSVSQIMKQANETDNIYINGLLKRHDA